MNEVAEREQGSREYGFLAGGGEMGERIRSKDWSKTPLGPVESWPQSLRTIVRMMLTSQQPIWIGWGPQLIKLYNDPYKAIVGGKHPEALGQPASVVWREIWDDIEPMLAQVMGQNQGTYVESQLLIMERYGYPEETYYTFSYNPVPAEDGGVGGMICTNTDDTQRVIGERQLALLRTLAAETADARTTEEACELAVKSLQHNPYDLPFALLYLVDHENKTINLSGSWGLSQNRQAAPERVRFGAPSPWPFTEVMRTGKPSFIPDLQECLERLPASTWGTPVRQAVAIPIQQSGVTGKAGILVVGLNPLRKFDDSYQGFVSLVAGQIASSIAHARAYEEERKRAEALAEIDRAKTAFFSNVSHEFRTPLTLMLGPIEDALRDPETVPANKERMEVAHRNAIRLLKLVNALLDFSRIEAGRMQAVYEPTDLATYTADLASSFRSAIEKAGMKLVVDCPPVGELVYIDREMWEKIVLNLLSNAFKFTLNGSITVSLRRRSGTIELSVQDTGVGIPEHELPRIFERFHRVQGSEGRTYEGTGIGLSLVQELVKLHGGSISVESQHGKGSTFTVSLPLGTTHLPRERLANAPRASTALGIHAYVDEALHWLPGRETSLDIIPDLSSPAQGPAVIGAGDAGQQADNVAETASPRILLADDNADMRDYVSRLLAERYSVQAVKDGREALAAAAEYKPDLILTDVMMPHMDGFELLRALRDNPETRAIPIIMLSARAGEEARIEGAQAGADDYLVKPFSARELLACVEIRLETARLRAEAEKAVRAEREHLYELFMQAPAIIAVLKGPNHVFDLANPLYLQLIGQGRNIIGKTILEALPEIEDQGFVELLDRVYTSGEKFTGNEVPVQLDRHGDGQLENVYLNFVYQPYTDTQGTIQGVLVHAVDVTELVRARQKVEESEARLRALVDADIVGVITATLDGEITQANGAFLRMSGFTAADIRRGRLRWDRMSITGRRRHERTVLIDLQAKGSFEPVEREFTRKDGGRVPVLIGGAMVNHEKGEFIVLVLDITERKKLEQRKDDFIALASHELKTPVTALKLHTQLLQKRFLRSGDETMGVQFHRMNSQLDKLTDLVHSLLDASRIEAGKLDLNWEQFPIQDLISEVASDLEKLSEKHTFILNDSGSITVCADRDRIRQVLVNLITNAIKYSPQAGRIIISTAAGDEEVKVSVQDFGIGIAEDEQDRIFERFFQVKTTGNGHGNTYPGLGLGLYICSEIIRRHDGRIWVESQPGEGSTFSFTLPTHTTECDSSM